MYKLALAVSAIALAAGTAQAQTAPLPSDAAPRAYVGLGAAIADNHASGNVRASPKIFAGLDLDAHWGVEAGYVRFGKVNDDDWIATAQFPSRSAKGYSTYVAGKYTLPLNEQWSAYGKLGVQHSKRTEYVGGWEGSVEQDNGAYGAVGLQYALNPKLSLVGEYERYGKQKTMGAKADVLTVGLKYGF